MTLAYIELNPGLGQILRNKEALNLIPEQLGYIPTLSPQEGMITLGDLT